MTREHLHILLVEDNPGDADLIKEVLADSPLFHFRFTGVARMSEALVVLARETVDIILLDLNLPDSNGIATVSEINEKALDIPIVVLTGTDDPQLGVEAIKAGAQDYLVK
jgi:DNA-binding response OmpR family regulator